MPLSHDLLIAFSLPRFSSAFLRGGTCRRIGDSAAVTALSVCCCAISLALPPVTLPQNVKPMMPVQPRRQLRPLSMNSIFDVNFIENLMTDRFARSFGARARARQESVGEAVCKLEGRRATVALGCVNPMGFSLDVEEIHLTDAAAAWSPPPKNLAFSGEFGASDRRCTVTCASETIHCRKSARPIRHMSGYGEYTAAANACRSSSRRPVQFGDIAHAAGKKALTELLAKLSA